MPKKIILVFGPIMLAALVVCAGLRRNSDEGIPVPARNANKPTAPLELPPIKPATPPRSSERAASQAKGVDDVQLRHVYESFRIALGSGQPEMAEAVAHVLRKNREAAIRLAEIDVSRATTTFDRSIALQALETLRR